MPCAVRYQAAHCYVCGFPDLPRDELNCCQPMPIYSLYELRERLVQQGDVLADTKGFRLCIPADCYDGEATEILCLNDLNHTAWWRRERQAQECNCKLTEIYFLLRVNGDTIEAAAEILHEIPVPRDPIRADFLHHATNTAISERLYCKPCFA